jgi:hypothetical protein
LRLCASHITAYGNIDNSIVLDWFEDRDAPTCVFDVGSYLTPRCGLVEPCPASLKIPRSCPAIFFGAHASLHVVRIVIDLNCALLNRKPEDSYARRCGCSSKYIQMYKLSQPRDHRNVALLFQAYNVHAMLLAVAILCTCTRLCTQPRLRPPCLYAYL